MRPDLRTEREINSFYQGMIEGMRRCALLDSTMIELTKAVNNLRDTDLAAFRDERNRPDETETKGETDETPTV